MAEKLHKAEIYASAVRDGEIVCCEFVKQAVARYFRDHKQALDKGWYFDRPAALKAISFVEKLEHTKGDKAGQKLVLEPWQCFVLWNLFGWKNADGLRRFKYSYVEVSRKNGKTTFAAGLALYMLQADGEARPEIYSVATTKEQARISFKDASAVVKQTALKNYLSVMRNSIVHELRGGAFQALSSDADTQDGWSPHFCIIDEYHAHKDSGMFDVMKSGLGARSQPMMFTITTAGFNKSGPCFAYRENVIKVLGGINEDDTLFAMIFTLDNPDEWENPQMWQKANPNLGVSCKASYMADQVLDAKNRPEAVRNVMTKNMNLWVDAEKTWILDEMWMRCGGDIDTERLKGRHCWGGLDLSNVSDITCLVLIFNLDDKFQLLPYFWIPEDKLLEKVRKENINYDKWLQSGFVKMTPGNVTDYDFVKEDILNISINYNLQSIGYDPWNSSQLIINLQDEGFQFSPFRQGYGSMAAPTKEFETLVLTQKIEHFSNPVLRWMIASTVIERDPAGNMKPNKAKSSQKIDGVVASIMALGEWMTAQATHTPSVYETRGLRD